MICLFYTYFSGGKKKNKKFIKHTLLTVQHMKWYGKKLMALYIREGKQYAPNSIKLFSPVESITKAP